jgi:hypothetical protein
MQQIQGSAGKCGHRISLPGSKAVCDEPFLLRVLVSVR